MTKQEEVFYILQDVRLGELTEYEATVKLQELGVVIKVDRELPNYDDYYKATTFTPRFQQARHAAWSKGQLQMLKAGCGFFEPLIKENKE